MEITQREGDDLCAVRGKEKPGGGVGLGVLCAIFGVAVKARVGVNQLHLPSETH